jgi:Fe-S oxidoreductase
MDRWIGIDERRTLPRFADQTFEAGFRKRPPRPDFPEPIGRVVLFHDTFMNFNHPEIGRAATGLLEAAGYEVRLADRVCCGRPMISKGLVETARRHAAHNVRELYRWVSAGYAVVGCEPSCLLTFRDEYRNLVSGPEVERVAESSFLLEEFIDRETGAGRWKLRFLESKPRALLHTHCHQKALVGSEQLKRVLNQAYAVDEVDSGCCGMAGSFGYEKEHYDVSMAVGRRRLFPAVEKDRNAIVIAPGVSCRAQIADAAGRQALHPAEALLAALGS